MRQQLKDILENDPDIKKQTQDHFDRTDRNINGFMLPIYINNDSEYADAVSKILTDYYNYLNSRTAFKNIAGLIADVKNSIENINLAITDYLLGDIKTAIERIKSILEKYKNNKFFISELDRSYAFRGVAPFKNMHSASHDYSLMDKAELTFFKARISQKDLSLSDMYHIPLDKRELVKTNRFSIPGIPCIYLGTTSYCCWKELKKPFNHEFWASAYKFSENGKKLNVLNLVVPQSLLNGIFSGSMVGENNGLDDLHAQMLKIFPLVIATSFSVKENDQVTRTFKSEYIVSHLIMHCLKALQIDGVAYLSRQGKNDFQYPQGVNLALPVFKNNYYAKYGDICKNLIATLPINYEKFLHIKDISADQKSYVNQIYSDKCNYSGNVDFETQSAPYSSLHFSEFDDFLCSQEFYQYG